MARFLRSNLQKRASATGFPEFELGRMKFILMVDRPELVHKYMGFFDRAYRIIRDGGFGKFWYGLVFLSPELESLSEVQIQSYLASGYKRSFVEHRAGYYLSGQDTMALTQPVDSWLVDSIVHEIGHRYWFRGMDQEQRLRFRSLINIPQKLPEVRLIPSTKGDEAKSTVDALANDVRSILRKFLTTRVSFYPKALKAFDTPLFDAGRAFNVGSLEAIQQVGAYTRDLEGPREKIYEMAALIFQRMSRAYETLNGEMSKFLSSAGDDLTREALAAEFKARQKLWISDTINQLSKVVGEIHSYIDASIESHNQEEQAKHDKLVAMHPNGSIEPVSDYGRSNIVEAFADAFAYYLMGKTMRTDQKESLKAVLSKRADLNPPLGGGPCRVVDRIMKKVRDPRLRETMIGEVEGGHSLPNFEARKVYQFDTEKGSAFKTFSITPHAQYRMDLRGIKVEDVARALDSFAERLVSVKGTKAFDWYMSQETITWMDPKTKLEVAFGMGDDTINIITTYWKGKKDPPPVNCGIDRVVGRTAARYGW